MFEQLKEQWAELTPIEQMLFVFLFTQSFSQAQMIGKVQREVKELAWRTR